MVWKIDNPQGHESRKIAHMAVPFIRGQGIDFGCGTEKVFPHCIGVDSGHHFGRGAADFIAAPGAGGVTTLPFSDATLDFVFSAHALEHVEAFELQLEEFWRVLKVGGWLSLYLPHKAFYPNIGQPGANPDHKHDFEPSDIIDAMRELAGISGYGWSMLENEERNANEEYSFWLVFKKEDSHECHDRAWRRPEGKTALVIRYGAIGDQIIASSGLAALKKAGWHVTYNTTMPGREVVLNDPNIDAFWIQDKDEVPPDQLASYWFSLQMEGRWDTVFNLSESIEVGMLATKGSLLDLMPDSVRRALCGSMSYLERTHRQLAVPMDRLEARFYPTEDEIRAAAAWRTAKGAVPVIIMPVAGSSFHKVYPWYNIVIAWLLQRTPAHVVLISGDPRGELFCGYIVDSIRENTEAFLEMDGRIEVHAGDWSLRTALTAMQFCDVACGPETGMMWAAAWALKTHKVLMLSHSSRKNLGGDWPNTTVLEPKDTPCFPCHRMHMFSKLEDLSRCTIALRGADGHPAASACTANITPEAVTEAIIGRLRLQAKPIIKATG